MSGLTVAWVGVGVGAFAAGAAIVGILALRRAFEPLIALLGAVGIAVAVWSLVDIAAAYSTARAVATVVGLAMAIGAGGFAFASALLDYLARPPSRQSPLLAEDIQDTDRRPVVFLVSPTETQEYEPTSTARELHDLADDGVLRLGLGVTPFLFAASKARYRASGGTSPAWRELERLAEAVEDRLRQTLRGRVVPTSCEGPDTLDTRLREAVAAGAKHVAVIPVAVAEAVDLETCKNRVDDLRLDDLDVTVEYAPPLWSSDKVSESIARRIVAGAIDPDSTGVVLVLHGEPGPRAQRYPAFEEHESAFVSRVKMLVADRGIPSANIRVAWLEWNQPDITTAVRHLAALGCNRVLVSPAVFPFDSIATQLEIPLMVRQARVDSIPVVMLPTWHDDTEIVEELARSAQKLLGAAAEAAGET